MKAINSLVIYQIISIILLIFSQNLSGQDIAMPTTKWQIKNHTPSTHLVLIQAEVIKHLELKKGDFLGAFTMEGQCYGTIQINSASENHCLTLYGDDVYTDVKDGFTDGELILVRQFQTKKGEEKDLVIEFDPTFPNQGNFASHGVSAIKMGELSVGSVGNSGELGFNLFPNPSTGKITLSWSQEGQEPASIFIYNAFGQLVEEIPFGISKAGVQTFTADISNLGQGTYLVKIKSGERFGMKKLIIMK